MARMQRRHFIEERVWENSIAEVKRENDGGKTHRLNSSRVFPVFVLFWHDQKFPRHVGRNPLTSDASSWILQFSSVLIQIRFLIVQRWLKGLCCVVCADGRGKWAKKRAPAAIAHTHTAAKAE